jgi:hypothetical protein
MNDILIDLLAEERDALRKQLKEIDNPSLQFLRDEFSQSGRMLKLCMAGFAQMFNDQGAKNYIEISFLNAKDEEFIFTVQKRDGKTPNQLRQEAEKNLDIAIEALKWYSDYSSGNSKKADEALAEIERKR